MRAKALHLIRQGAAALVAGTGLAVIGLSAWFGAAPDKTVASTAEEKDLATHPFHPQGHPPHSTGGWEVLFTVVVH